MGRKDHNFKIGSLVWLNNENLRLVRACRKLDSKRVGPFKIVKFVNEVAILFGFIVFHVSLLLLYKSPLQADTGIRINTMSSAYSGQFTPLGHNRIKHIRIHYVHNMFVMSIPQSTFGNVECDIFFTNFHLVICFKLETTSSKIIFINILS